MCKIPNGILFTLPKITQINLTLVCAESGDKWEIFRRIKEISDFYSSCFLSVNQNTSHFYITSRIQRRKFEKNYLVHPIMLIRQLKFHDSVSLKASLCSDKHEKRTKTLAMKICESIELKNTQSSLCVEIFKLCLNVINHHPSN